MFVCRAIFIPRKLTRRREKSDIEQRYTFNVFQLTECVSREEIPRKPNILSRRNNLFIWNREGSSDGKQSVNRSAYFDNSIILPALLSEVNTLAVLSFCGIWSYLKLENASLRTADSRMYIVYRQRKNVSSLGITVWKQSKPQAMSISATIGDKYCKRLHQHAKRRLGWWPEEPTSVACARLITFQLGDDDITA